jgi:hypothetical protein
LIGVIDPAWRAQPGPPPPSEAHKLRALVCRSRAFPPTRFASGLHLGWLYKKVIRASIVVLPSDVAERASQRLELFASLDVGLWSFDPDTDVIAKYFTPHQGTARNLEARNKAIESILNKIQL